MNKINRKIANSIEIDSDNEYEINITNIGIITLKRY